MIAEVLPVSDCFDWCLCLAPYSPWSTRWVLGGLPLIRYILWRLPQIAFPAVVVYPLSLVVGVGRMCPRRAVGTLCYSIL